MYWERDQEINLLHIILEANHPDEDAGKVDQIICGLIDMDLVDCDRAPWAQRAWQDHWNGGYGVPFDFVSKYYVTEDEYLDSEPEYEAICAHCDVEITTGGDGWVDEDGGTVCAQMSADGPTNRLHVPETS